MANKRLALWVDGVFRKDEIFNPDSQFNLDDKQGPIRLLRDYLKAAGWDCHTADFYLENGEIPDAVLFFDIPRKPVSRLVTNWEGRVRKLGILFECPVIKPQNWDRTRHAEFDVIFTWSDAIVDGKKYFKLDFPQKFTVPSAIGLETKDKFCLLIAGNKRNSHQLELYSERVRTIRWFEKNHPEEFDLYGLGWERFAFGGPRIVRALNRITPLTRFLGGNYPSYRGKVTAKVPLMNRYKFAICYENARDIPGYITEKIFDCFFAGCVPVYWGAPDIERFIPKDCFIDRRDFQTHEALYEHMKMMSSAAYSGKLNAIRTYLSSDSAVPFSDTHFARTVLLGVTGG